MSDQVTTQTLDLSDDGFTKLRSGQKTHTIRLGEREIEPGFLEYRGVVDQSLSEFVWVKDVYYIRLKGVAVKLGEDLDTLVKNLSRFYPDIDGETKVTLVMHLTPEETKRIFPQAN